MFPGAQARVLYGYMDGKLKVQYTELQQVTTSNFEEMIGSLLKWSLPTIDGDTTDVVTLPTIEEEDEEDDVVSSPTKTVEKAQNPTKNQVNECTLRLLPDASATAASHSHPHGNCAVQLNSNNSSTSLSTSLITPLDLNTSFSTAQLRSKECATRLLLTNITNSPTLTTEPSTQQHKYHWPTKRHSCSWYTCTVAAKNLVVAREEVEIFEQPSERSLWSFEIAEFRRSEEIRRNHRAEMKKFEKIRKRNLANMKKG